MPVCCHELLHEAGEWGLWKIREDEAWFLSRLDLYPAEAAQLAAIKGHRRLEWLAARHLLHSMSGRTVRGAVVKDAFGKPHLHEAVWQISLSHSREYAAAIAAPGSVGIDIQHFVPKIERIAHKFMTGRDLALLEPETRLQHLHLYWCAKEALYKAYGRRELDFCRDIHIEPFPFDPAEPVFSGIVEKGDFRREYRLCWEAVEDYFLVYAVER